MQAGDILALQGERADFVLVIGVGSAASFVRRADVSVTHRIDMEASQAAGEGGTLLRRQSYGFETFLVRLLRASSFSSLVAPQCILCGPPPRVEGMRP